MALTKQDLEAIKKLVIPLEDRMTGFSRMQGGTQSSILGLESRVSELEEKIANGFNRMDESFDHLFKMNETREQEYLVIKHQLEELEKKCA